MNFGTSAGIPFRCSVITEQMDIDLVAAVLHCARLSRCASPYVDDTVSNYDFVLKLTRGLDIYLIKYIFCGKKKLRHGAFKPSNFTSESALKKTKGLFDMYLAVIVSFRKSSTASSRRVIVQKLHCVPFAASSGVHYTWLYEHRAFY